MKKLLLNSKTFATLFLLFCLFFTSNSFGQIAQRGSATTGTSTNTSLTINVPTGVVEGDIMIANLAAYDNPGGSSITCTGWTQISETTGLSRGYSVLLYRVVTAVAEPSSYTFISDATNNFAGAIVAFSGVNPVSPFDVTPSGTMTTYTPGASPNYTVSGVTQVTAATANDAILMFANTTRITSTASTNFNSWAVATSPTLTELYDVGNNGATSAAVGAAWGIKPATGGTGAGSVNNPTNTNPRACGAQIIALKALKVFYSKGSLAPNTPANWNTARNSSGTNAVAGDFTSGNVFVIENGDSMTTSGTWTISGSGAKVTIENGGALVTTSTVTLNEITLDSGSTLTINSALNISGGNWTNNGSTISGTGTVTLSGTCTIGGTTSTTFPANLTITGTVQQGINTSVSGNYSQTAGTYTVTPGGTAYTLTVTGNFTQSAGTFNVTGASATAGATVTVTGATSIFSIFMEPNASNTASTVLFQANGNATFTGSSTTTALDWMAGGVTGTAYNITFGIKGNFNWSNATGRPYTSGSGRAKGFVFNGTGTAGSPQTLTYSGSNNASSWGLIFEVNSGTYVRLLTGLSLGTQTNPASTFTIDGILDAQTFVISGSTAAGVKLNSGATLITANTGGVTSTITATTPTYNAAANYTFNGTANQNTGFSNTTMNNLTIANIGIGGANTVSINTAAPTVNGTLAVTNGILNAAAFQIIGNASNPFTLASGTTFRLSGSYPTLFTAGNTTFNAASTVEYFGATQTVSATPTYGNLTISTAGTKTAGGALTVVGNLTINTTATTIFAASTFTHTIAGNWINNGAFTAGTSTINFNGTTTISGSATNSFNNLTISGTLTGPSSANINVAGTWNNGGTFTHNSGTVTLNGTAQSITGSTTTFNNLILGTSGNTKTFGVSTTISGNLNINTGVIANLGTFSHTSATLTTGGTVRGTGTSYGGGTNSPAAIVDATFFNNTTGYLNVGACNSYSLTSTAALPVCLGGSATINVANTTPANLPTGTYTVHYTLSGANTGSSSSSMTVASAGSGSFITTALANNGATTITIDYLTNGCVSKTTSGNSASITINAQPTGPTLNVKSPNLAAVCSGTTVSATFNSGSGGTGCSDDFTVSIDGGAATAYTPGTSVGGSATSSIVIEGRRASCTSGAGCTGTSYVTLASWTVNPVFTAGAIDTTGETVCYNGNPAGINSLTAASGGDNVITYKWQANGVDIPSSNSVTFDPPSGLTLTTTYTRYAKDNTCNPTFTLSTGSWVVTISNDNTWTGGTSTAWTTASNWSCGIVPESVSDVTISTAGNYPEISSDVTINTLTLDSGTTLKVNSNYDLTVTDVIDNDGTVTLENNANLLQTNNVSNTGSGTTTVKRNSSLLKRLDYALWSSPVTGQGLYAFSPFTFANRFYVYRTTTNLYNNADIGFSITGLNGNGVNGTDGPPAVEFTTAKGYLIRMPWDHPAATATVWNGTFTGVPNNGDITYIMTSGASGFRFNLVGNPYPSPISMSQFVLDNSTKITGTLYFWRETNNNTSNNAYCTWAGGTFTSNGQAQVVNPSGIIRTGQGFIVEAQASQTVLSFKNGQRSSDNTNQFFKNNGVANSTTSVETNRFWLNLTNTAGAFSQMAAGYMTDATNGVDIYDGKNINTGNVLLNSVLNNEEYTIQGKSLPFNTADVIPLRYKITDAGNYTITLDHVDGLFTGGSQPIYVKDNLTATYHDLNTGSYSFASEAGTFNDRFEIVYALPLGVDNPSFTANAVIIYPQNNEFVVNSGTIIMASIKVFDIRGRLLEEKKDINANQTTIGSGLANEVLLVQITSEDGITVTKKVIR